MAVICLILGVRENARRAESGGLAHSSGDALINLSEDRLPEEKQTKQTKQQLLVGLCADETACSDERQHAFGRTAARCGSQLPTAIYPHRA